MSSLELPTGIPNLTTPCLLVDLNIVKRNAQVMIDRCKQMAVALRPMTKTHKCREACLIATGGTKKCIAVSTLAEAEFFVEDGYEDVLCTTLFTQDKIERLKKLAERVGEFHVCVDSMHGIELLEENSLDGGKQWSVYLLVDTGDGREGVLWDDDEDETVQIARQLSQTSHISFQGLYAHDGNSYGVQTIDEIKDIGSEGVERLLHFADMLRSKGIEVKRLGTGSTPTASHPSDNMKQLHELHPGNYLFYDAMQSCSGACTVNDIAVRVATRVVGHYPHRNQLLVDAGFTALSCDNKARTGIPDGSICLIQDQPKLSYVAMNQEYGVVERTRGKLDYSQYPIGTILYLWPWHACATAACHKQYYVHEGETVTQIWQPCFGW